MKKRSYLPKPKAAKKAPEPGLVALTAEEREQLETILEAEQVANGVIQAGQQALALSRRRANAFWNRLGQKHGWVEGDSYTYVPQLGAVTRVEKPAAEKPGG